MQPDGSAVARGVREVSVYGSVEGVGIVSRPTGKRSFFSNLFGQPVCNLNEVLYVDGSIFVDIGAIWRFSLSKLGCNEYEV